MKVRAAIIGVSGYSGLELAALILRHPKVDLVSAMVSEKSPERPLAEIHPLLRGRTGLICRPQNLDLLARDAPEIVFLCTPNEVSHELGPAILNLGMRVVDLSGSFRLRDAGLYPEWYDFEHLAPALLREAVYGLPEWNSAAIAGARLVANPGCYPTSILLPLLPLARESWIAPGSHIVCDSKSGATGAGRQPKLGLLFCELSANFRAYSPIRHRHAPEICQELGWDPENLSFVPHLLPVDRGILSTIYLSFSRPVEPDEIEAAYARRYRDCRFLRLLGSDALPELKDVRGTNCCDIAWRLTAGGTRGVIFSALDNLVKGAAGQAVQNLNLMHGFEESCGLSELR